MEKSNLNNILAWIKDGKYRLRILKVLEKEKLLSSEVAEKINNHRSTTSRILKNLKEKNLVSSISLGSRTRMYQLTELGLAVLKEL